MKNYKCPTCPCKSPDEPDEWLAGTHCDCPCHLPKKNEPNDGYKDHRWNASSCGLEDTGNFADHLEEIDRE